MELARVVTLHFCYRSIAQSWHNCITNSTQHFLHQTLEVRKESLMALTPTRYAYNPEGQIGGTNEVGRVIYNEDIGVS
jgi:hypothetical protein